MFTQIQKLPQFHALCLLTALVLHIFSGLSRESTNFLLVSLHAIVTATYTACIQTFGIEDAKYSRLFSMSDWAFDIRTVIATFPLHPDLVHYACCPRCFALYAPESNQKYPRKCTFRKFEGGEECGSPITAASSGSGNRTTRPIRTFAYQPLTTWLARFLARPGLTKFLEENPAKHRTSHSGLVVSDILQGAAVKALVGCNGKPFFESSPGGLQLVFNLNIDWFNPYGSRKSGRQYSVGIICMTVANLPIQERYKACPN